MDRKSVGASLSRINVIVFSVLQSQDLISVQLCCMTFWKWWAMPCILTMENSFRRFCTLLTKNTSLKFRR